MAKNSLAMGMVQLITQISTLILGIVMSAYWNNPNGLDDYEIYTSAYSVVTLVFLIADLGLGTKMIIDVAQNKDIAGSKLTSILLIRGALGFVAICMTIAYVMLQHPSSNVAYAYIIIALSTGLSWIAQTFTSMFTAFEKMYYVFLTYLVERMFTIPISIALILMGYGLETVVMVVLTGAILYVFLSYTVCSKLIVKPSRRVSLKDMKSDLRASAPFAINVGLVSTLYSVNGFLLITIVAQQEGFDAGQAAGNIFTVAFGLVAALIAVPTVFRSALLPVITRLFGTSKEMTKLAQQKIMKYMYSLGLPMTLGGIVLAPQIIGLLYSDRPGSIVILQILLPVLAISYFGTGQGSLLAAANLMRLSTVSSMAGAAANLVICFVAIPVLGAAGAALAFTVATLIMNIVSHYYMSKRVVHLKVSEIIVRPTLAGLGMTAVLLLLPWDNLFISLAIGAVTYFALLYMLKAVDHEDIEIFRKALNKGV